jgi:hypothetical protein
MSRTRRSVAALAAAGAVAAGLGTAGVANAATTLRASLSGANESTEGQGTGTARLTVDAKKGRVCFRITLKGTGPVAAGHIHQGARGKDGPVVVALFEGATRRPRGCVGADDGVKKSVLRAILRKPRNFYVNVHNQKFPGGVARGQLRK